jgi:IclR family acetate operon transcriptional repressor
MSSVDRALRIIELLEGKTAMTVAGISANLKMPRSTVHRLLTPLCAHEFIVRDTSRGKYQLGRRAFELGDCVAKRFGIGSFTISRMEVLAEASHETVNFGVLVNDKLFYLENITHDDEAIRVHLQVGSSVPPHCTALGKAILAFMAPEELESTLPILNLERRTPRSITQLADLREELVRIHRRGFAFDNSELCDGISCIAAPILSAEGFAIAAIGVSGPSLRMSPEKASIFIPVLRVAAAKISTAVREA